MWSAACDPRSTVCGPRAVLRPARCAVGGLWSAACGLRSTACGPHAVLRPARCAGGGMWSASGHVVARGFAVRGRSCVVLPGPARSRGVWRSGTLRCGRGPHPVGRGGAGPAAAARGSMTVGPAQRECMVGKRVPTPRAWVPPPCDVVRGHPWDLRALTPRSLVRPPCKVVQARPVGLARVDSTVGAPNSAGLGAPNSVVRCINLRCGVANPRCGAPNLRCGVPNLRCGAPNLWCGVPNLRRGATNMRCGASTCWVGAPHRTAGLGRRSAGLGCRVFGGWVRPPRGI